MVNSAAAANPKRGFKLGLKVASGLRKFRTTGVERDVLQNAGTISANVAKAHAESEFEFEKYRLIQDQKFQSDFDKEIKDLTTSKAAAKTLTPKGKKDAS